MKFNEQIFCPTFIAPVVVASQQMSTHPTHPVQFQGNNFQPNPSAPYLQTYQIHMPMAPNQQFPQPYQNVYPQQPPPYPGIPQQQPNNQGGFKIGVETFSSTTTTTNGTNFEESRNTTRY